VSPTLGRTAPVVAVLLAVTLALPSCGRGEELRSEALASSTSVTFEADGVELGGRLFGTDDATAGVVLAHMLPADQSAWFETAAALGEEGYRVLTFNFRGYCPGGDAGCSTGDKDVDAADDDLRAALAALRDRGVAEVALVGASMGGTAALIVASDEGVGVEAVVTLSAPQRIGDLVVLPDALAALTAAKLYVAGTGDATAAEAAQAFYDGSQQPKRFELVTTDDHGTDLLDGNQGSRVESLIEDWITAHLPATGGAAT
jgi:pimeloyl-ACP methyl ester carboxylesterase